MLTAITSVAPYARRAGKLAAVLLVLAASGIVRGQEETDPGRVLAVAAPITPDAAARLREAITDAIKRAGPQRGDRFFKIILDFNPDGRANRSRDFGTCYDLAKFLREKQGEGVRTIAYVHSEVTNHSVLPVLACAPQIVFSRSGELGEVIRDPSETLGPVERTAYEEIARDRFPLALVRKMYDRDLVVVRTNDPDGVHYRDARENKPGEPVLLAGTFRYKFDQAIDFGICERVPRETVADVAAAYKLGRVENETQPGKTAVAWLLTLDGPVDGGLRERFQRKVSKAISDKANVLFFVLRCHGGDSGAAADIAEIIEKLNKDRADNPIRTIAYVTDQASDTALFAALACDRIVMHPKASLGGFDKFIEANPGHADIVRKNLEELAARHSYPPQLVLALADGNARVYRVLPVRGGGSAQFISKADLDEDVARAGKAERQWKDAREVKTGDGKCLNLDAETARSYGLSVASVDDIGDVYQLEGLEASQVHDATRDRDWLEDLADFLRDPWTSVVLVMVGITCLILELKMPGVSLPGIIAAVCFVLFFWSHSQLNGQITWLALLLFVLGLLLIGLEVFVMPGVGVLGISGTVLVLGSLGLVAYGHWPHSNEEWIGLGKSIGPFGISVLGALVAAFLLARFLPNIPFANRLLLKPADEAGEFGEDSPATSSSSPDFSGLLGAVGVAATPLRPAGKVQFGDDFVDVVAEGGYVPPGTRVQVIEIEGNRIVVKEV
jgi:membrane-bound ClpP family serine protease